MNLSDVSGTGEGPGSADPRHKPMVVVFDSPDIAATVGQPGLLEGRVSTHKIVREGAVRSDVLAQTIKGIRPPDGAPKALAIRHTLAADPATSLVILSLLPEMDAAGNVYRHIDSGWLVAVNEPHGAEVGSWLEAECEVKPKLSIEETSNSIRDAISIIRGDDRAVGVFNVSTYDPDDQTHRFAAGVADPYSVRANRLLAAFETIAGELGVFVVDVDGAVAELGAAKHVPRAGEFSKEAAAFITEDAGLLIDQSGVFGTSVQAPVMRVEVPAYDRRTTHGTLAVWHVNKGRSVQQGDPLFDVRFDGLVYRVTPGQEESERKAARRAARRRASLHPTLVLEVLAGGEGYVAALAVSEGDRVKVGDTAAVITTTTDREPSYDSSTPTFRLGMRAKT